MNYFVLRKNFFDDFISCLTKISKVVAPVQKGYNKYEFEEIKAGSQISLKYIPTILPPKKYFMPQYEVLAEYNLAERQKMQAIVEYEPLIIFGVHTCDLSGIQCLNMVFSDRPKDLNYLIRKKYITIIGLECNEYCDEYASCGLMDSYLPKGGYDLFFTDLGEFFVIHVQTITGEEIVKKARVVEDARAENLAKLEELRVKKREIFKNEVDVELDEIPELFDRGFNHPVWEEIGNRCLSCANCTNVCPTCYCFDVMDQPHLDLKTGKRIRVWDSCQNEPFAKIASGESFRAKRSDRKRHRFYRKFKYHNLRFSRYFCTGCGRCSRTCMAKINLKETILALKEEKV